MKRDPYMEEEGQEDEDSSSESDLPKSKRPRPEGGGFSFGEAPVEGPSAELQLEAMLAAEGQPLPTASTGNSMTAPSVGKASIMGPSAPTAATSLSRLNQNMPIRQVPVPKNLVVHLMTPAHRELLIEESGAEVEWAREERKVELRGSAEQVRRATRLLQRVLMHCHWGRSQDKVSRLLRPKMVESTICRLSPMNSLRPAEKTLNCSNSTFSIGKDKGNDLVIQEPIISRQHCVLELDNERGAVYAIDCSTNGTFLNGVRLPSKTVGKVLLSHGDELLLKDPASGEQEFGYIVNLNELHVKEHVKLEAPRRLFTSEELANASRD